MIEFPNASIIVRNSKPIRVLLDGYEIPGIESAVINLDGGRPMSITVKIIVKSVVSIEKGDTDINEEG